MALKLAKGNYQRNILLGYEAISGATLRGRARSYCGRYRRSAENLIRRCLENNLPIKEVVGEHNKRIIVIG
jgi:hypothetical protein